MTGLLPNNEDNIGSFKYLRNCEEKGNSYFVN